MAKKTEEGFIRLNFYIDPEHKARLEKLADQTDRTVAKMIRRAIEAYLDAEEAIQRKRKA
jgi:predicted transcriptional regulator